MSLWPEPSKLQFDRLVEPMTGWAMLGLGAIWEASERQPLQVELLLDGQLWLEAPVQQTASGYHFGHQVPLPENSNQVLVRLRNLNTQEVGLTLQTTLQGLFTVQSPVLVRQYPKWLSPVVTLGKSVVSGDCFSPSWWSARVDRYRSFAIRAKQKLRDKLLLRQSKFHTLTHHEAYCQRTAYTTEQVQQLQLRLQSWKHKPTISVLMPVYNVEPKWLLEAVQSVRNQIYPHWQLCLADDASTEPATQLALNSLPKDDRIKLTRRSQNGHICQATNTAAEQATGEFVAFLDNDDRLAPQALFRMVEALQTRPQLDLLYSDEDKITAEGLRFDPQFKPDWSPELLLSYNYVNHFTVLRRSLFDRVGRLRVGYEGSQDHDLLLRVCEQTDLVHHVPEILYHWRSHAGSTASTATQKPIVQTSGFRAVSEALQRRGLASKLQQPAFAQELRLPILELTGQETGPNVAILVHGSAEQAAATVRAIKQLTTYKPFNTYLMLDHTNAAEGLNRLAMARSEELLLFLQAGLLPTDPAWLGKLVQHLKISLVGAVGARLQFASGEVLSGGTVLNLGEDGLPGDAFRGLKLNPVSYYFYAEVARNVTAPAKGCLLTTRQDFERLGGLDSRHYPETLFDLDYCLRLAGQGKRCVQLGGVVLQGDDAHGRLDSPTELNTFLKAYGRGADPFHNINFEEHEAFKPRTCPRIANASASTKRQRVLFGTHNLTAFEGAPKIIADVAIGLHQRGQVEASVFAPNPGKASSIFAEKGISVHAEALPFSQHFINMKWTPLHYEAAQSHLLRLFKQVRPEAVLANTLGLFPLIEAAARLNIPAVLAIQESYSESVFQALLSPYAQKRCERAFQLADRIIFASKSCAQLYERLDFRKNAVIVHNGLESSRLQAFQTSTTRDEAAKKLNLSTSDGVRLLSLGTICERKAQHHFVEALALLKDAPPFKAYLVGAREGVPYLHFVRTLIKRHGLEHRVELVPETDQVWSYLQASDVLVCTSYVEAHSLSVLEAQAFGLAIVSTPCGGLDEQVIWSQSALKYPFGEVTTLAEQLRSLLASPAKLHEMKRQSRANYGLHTDSTGMIEHYGLVLQEALQ